MSAYTTQALIQTLIAPQWLAAAFNDDGSNDPAAITAGITAIISQVSNDIDGRLAPIYVVPFVTAPPTVSAACLILCCEKIYKRRLSPEEKNPFSGEADEWRSYLKMICKDELTLDAQRVRAFPPIVSLNLPLSTAGNSR